MIAKTPIHPTLPEGKFIRVVNILPGKGTDASGICLEFVSKPVDIAADKASYCYEAISYVWGQSNITVDVNFKQQDDTMGFTLSAFAITQNLSEALLHLRREDIPRSVWIDAICINQEDNNEKSHQVSMMGDVYKKASKVVAWLGPSTEAPGGNWGSDLAMQVIEKTGRDIRHDWDTGFSILAGDDTYAYAPKMEWHRSITTDKAPTIYSHDEACAIVQLVDRPWFHRLWIRQEIKMAVDHLGDAIVQCGNVCVSWKAFSYTVAYMRRTWYGTGNTWAGHFIRFVFIHDLCRTTMHGYDLPTLPGAMTGAGCQDPRDKVYGVMSICQDLCQLGIVPDYHCEVSDLYEEVVRKYMSTYRSVDIFLATHFVEDCNKRNLPSWVPDWESYAHRTDLPTPLPRFGNYFALQDLPQDEERLAVSGTSLGTIKKVWPLFDAYRGHEQYAGTMIDMWRDGIKAIHIQDQLTQADEERIVEALCRTLFLGEEPSSDLDFGNTKTELEQGNCGGIDLRWRLAERTAVRTANRRFFITDTGRMGVGSNTIQTGDQVVSFLGSAMHFVINPCQTTSPGVKREQCCYRLRGGCYVHGMMALEPFLGPVPSNVTTVCRNGQLRLEDSRMPGHEIEDPRLERLKTVLEGSQEWPGRGHPKKLISTTPEQWQRVGVNIERFTLL